LGLGATSLGARALFDHVLASQPKLAAFHAVKMAVSGVSNHVPDYLVSADALTKRLAASATSPITYASDLHPSVGAQYTGSQIQLGSHFADPLGVYQRSFLGDADVAHQHLLEKAVYLAHEIGHEKWDKNPVGKVVQNNFLHGVGRTPLPHVLSMGAGLFAPTRTTRALGVVGGAISSGVPLLNEYMAGRYGQNLLKQVGADPVLLSGAADHNAANLAGYLRHTGINVGLGLASMGAREVYDWYKAKHSPEPEKKLADFHAVKCASNVFNALNWVPEPYKDRVQTPYQMLTSARNTPALTATQPNLRMLQISRENPQY